MERNKRLRDILEIYDNVLSSVEFKIELIKRYVKNAKILPSAYVRYITILELFKEVNSPRWQEKVLDKFIILTKANFNVNSPLIYGESNQQILTQVKEISPEIFISDYLYYGVNDIKKKIDDLYYSNIIYVLRMISSIRGNFEFSMSEYASANQISVLNIPYAFDSQSQLLFVRVILYNMLTPTQFKLEIMNEMSRKILDENALSGKADKFQITNVKKKIFSYLKYVKKLTNIEIKQDTSTPLWIIFLIRSRLFYLNRCRETSNYDWNVEEIPYIFSDDADFTAFMEREIILGKKIKVRENTELIDLLYFLKRLNDPAYNLTESEIVLHRTNLRNLKFEKVDDAFIQRRANSTAVEISRNLKIFIVSKCNEFITNLRRIPQNNRIFFTEDLVNYIWISIREDQISATISLKNLVNEVMRLDCFNGIVEIDWMPEDNFRFFLRVNS